jgi:signal transduction histidine kinase
MLGLELENGRVAFVADTTGPLVSRPVSGQERPGYGLIGMQERATALGGQCAAGPTPAGWRVTCELPVEDGRNG